MSGPKDDTVAAMSSTPSPAPPAGLAQCDDFIQFENALRESRSIDDKIIQALNNSIPTASFRGQVDVQGKCRELWQTVRIDNETGSRGLILLSRFRSRAHTWAASAPSSAACPPQRTGWQSSGRPGIGARPGRLRSR